MTALRRTITLMGRAARAKARQEKLTSAASRRSPAAKAAPEPVSPAPSQDQKRLKTTAPSPPPLPASLLSVAGRLLALDRPEDAPERLLLVGRLRADIEAGLPGLVLDARAAGASWADVGTALGTSRQAAHGRYGDAS